MTAYTALFAIVLTALFSTSAFAGNPKSYRGSLIHTNDPYVRVGGDKLIFGYKLAPSCDEPTLKQLAIDLKTRSRTDRWDDLWYAFNVPSGRCLMMGWYNLNSKKFGWAAVQNKPNTWGVRSNHSGWQDIGNGQQKKYSYKINGQNVDLDIYNPMNEGGLSGDDILISFGF